MPSPKYQKCVVTENLEDPSPEELDKRTYAPYTVTADCPKCGKTADRNLAERYLSYPVAGKPHDLHMYCEDDDCGQEFVVRVIARITVEAAS